MRYIIKALAYLSFSFLYVSCQEDVHDRRLALEELPSVKSKELVVLVNNEDFIMLATTESVNKILKRWVHDYDLEEDKKLLKLVDQHKTGGFTIIRADSIARINKLKWRIELVAGDLMQSSKCLIYNKRSMQLERLVKVERYTSHSSWGRKFYARRTLLLKVMDGVE